MNKIAVLILLVSLLAGCAGAALDQGTPIPTLAGAAGYGTRTAVPSPTLTATPTATSSPIPSLTHTPTATFQPSPTSTATPTFTPTPFRTPNPALTAGEWILYSLPEAGPPYPFQNWAVIDRRGGEYGRFSLPPLPQHAYYNLLFPPGGKYAAAYAINIITLEGFEAEIRIYRLPDAALIRRLPLYPFEKAHFDSDQVGYHSSTSSQTMIWSPDGRYLAYPVSDASGVTSIHIYDPQLDQDRQLAGQIQNAIPWAWTPDGRSLLVREVKIVEDFSIFGALSTWLVDVKSGQASPLPVIENRHRFLIGWTSPETFIVAAQNPAGPYEHLQKINLRTGAAQTLYEGLFMKIALDPASGTILLFIEQNDSQARDGKTGLYRLDGPEAPRLLVEGEIRILRWLKELGRFHVVNRSAAGGMDLLLDLQGIERLRLPSAITLDPSPDGRWIYNYARLFSAGGVPAAGFSLEDPAWSGLRMFNSAAWLPDSSGLIQGGAYGSELEFNNLYLRRAAAGWQPELIAKNVGRWEIVSR